MNRNLRQRHGPREIPGPVPVSRRRPARNGAARVVLAAACTGLAGLAAAARAQPFEHPGLLHKEADFQRMRDRIAAGEQPWLDGWNKLASSPYAAPGWTPRAVPVVIRGARGDNVSRLSIDVARAYQCALRWKIGGDRACGDTARGILNAWSATLASIDGSADRYLAAGLCGYQFANAAEVMRGYPGFDVARARRMFLEVFYRPRVERFLHANGFGADHNGAHIENYWANWDLCNMAAAVAIGIFCDRADIYERALDYYKFGAGNGSVYHAVRFLHGDLGQWQEAGRDQGHTTLGVGLLAATAEMAWNQGDDLYGWAGNRLLKGAEYVARYNERGLDVPFAPYQWHSGNPGTLKSHTGIASAGRGATRPVWEMIYNHHANRKGEACDNVAAAAAARRPEGGPDARVHPSTFDQPGFGTLAYTRPAGTGGAEAAPHLGNVGDGTYSFIARHSGKALTAAGTANHARVEQRTATGAAGQQWRVTHLGGGEYRIASVPGGRLLEIAGGSFANGGAASARVADAAGGPNQRFAFIPLGDGCHRILPAHSGKSLGVSAGSTADGADVLQWKFLRAPDQQWRLVKAAGTPRTAPVVTAAAGPANHIDLRWTTSPGATGYNVKRSCFTSGPYRLVATGVAGTTCRDAGTRPGVTYSYIVAPVNDTGEGADSAPVTATAGPAAPPRAAAAPPRAAAARPPAGGEPPARADQGPE